MSNLKEYAQKYLQSGTNVIPLQSNKAPIGAWKQFQNTLNNVNGNFERAEAIGTICGAISNNLEVLDFDTKHDASGALWDDFLFACEVNDLDTLLARLPIVKTRSGGYHILYRCQFIEGNKKVALNKQGEAVIETRGEGGYVVAYPSVGYTIVQNDTLSIPFISIEDRARLFGVCAMFNEIEHKQSEPKQEAKQTYQDNDSPFDAFNRNKPTELLKEYGWSYKNTRGNIEYYTRPNSKSRDVHASLREIENTWVFYSFSSNCYPLEPNKGYNPVSLYMAFTGKTDKKEIARDFVNMGFGSFKKKEEVKQSAPKAEPKQTEAKDATAFPLHVFPRLLQDLVIEYSTKRDMPQNLLAMSLAVAFSGASGLNHKLVMSNGWESYCSLFVALVGNASVGKSPTMDFAMSPLIKVEKEYQKDYEQRLNEYKLWEADKSKDKGVMNEPERYELIISDATLEALITAHNTNKKGLLLHRDELLGWVRAFNAYRKGSDQQAWLSLWSNGMVKNNRKNSGIQFIDKSFVSVFGGLQPAVISELAKENRQEDGFLYRILFVFAEETRRKTWAEINAPVDKSLYAKYCEAITNIALEPYLDTPHEYQMSEEASDIWAGWYDSNDDFKSTNDEIASIASKLSQYCTRFALLLQIMDNACNNLNRFEISEANMIGAIQLCEYFKQNAMQALGVIAEQKMEKQEVKSTSVCNWAKIFEDKTEMTTSEITAKILEVYGKSERTARNWIAAELKKVSHGVWSL